MLLQLAINIIFYIQTYMYTSVQCTLRHSKVHSKVQQCYLFAECVATGSNTKWYTSRRGTPPSYLIQGKHQDNWSMVLTVVSALVVTLWTRYGALQIVVLLLLSR